MKVVCRTNLDLREQWPDQLPTLPNIGDHIQSRTKHGIFQLSLRVCRITWRWSDSPMWNDWYPEIELHMTEFQQGLPCSLGPESKGSLVAFYEWYAPLVGKHKSAFI